MCLIGDRVLTVEGSGLCWNVLAAALLAASWCVSGASYAPSAPFLYSHIRHTRSRTRTYSDVNASERASSVTGKPFMTEVDQCTSGCAGGAKVGQVSGKQHPKVYLKSFRHERLGLKQSASICRPKVTILTSR